MHDVTEPALIKHNSTSVKVKNTWICNSIPPYISFWRGRQHVFLIGHVYRMYKALVGKL
jgi:hypothetical protein